VVVFWQFRLLVWATGLHASAGRRVLSLAFTD